MRWRIAVNPYNVDDPPWRDAIGIEEDSSDAVPAMICWLLRGHGGEVAQSIVDAHNALLGVKFPIVARIDGPKPDRSVAPYVKFSTED